MVMKIKVIVVVVVVVVVFVVVVVVVVFALSTPYGFRSNSKENKKPIFYHNPWFKILRWFQTVPF